MPNPELVSALDLDQWADSLASRSVLPRLVRRLILANAAVTQIAMRAGEGTGLPGWDGLVEATVGDPHVPLGTSRWEISTGARPIEKAQENYAKRTTEPQDVDPASTTFIFVTPRLWSGRDVWKTDRQSEGRWADVRAYDADDLETWLERTPSVHIWISELLGRDPRDVKTVDSWWECWTTQTVPPLTRSFLLAGRDDFATSLKDSIRGPDNLTSVVVHSREEAVACTVAALLDPADELEGLSARSLVVSGSSAWDRIIDSTTPLILIPTIDDVDVSAALAKGHHVIAPVADRMRQRGSGISAAPLDRQSAADALESVGVSRDVARRYAGQARRSMMSLRRTIAVSPLVRKPTWAEAPGSGHVVPVILAGAWIDDQAGDRQAIQDMTGRQYADIESELAAWSTEEDAPTRRSGRQWQVVAKDDGWDLVSSFVTQTDIDRFLLTAIATLRETDPALDLEPDRRFMAAVLGAQRTHSNVLREALADSAAFLGGYVAGAPLQPGGTGEQLAARMVHGVLDGVNADPTSEMWSSLTDVLPLLAEAAPDIFLTAVEGGLTGDPPPLSSLFPAEIPSGFGSSSLHVGLIWALQNLCWSPDYLSRAAAALARIAPLDQGNRSGPHPAAALAQALNLFLPQTAVPLERRLAVIDGLRRRHPDAAWDLMRSILPSDFGMLDYAHTPRWRTWHRGVSNEINHADVGSGTAELVTRMLVDVQTKPQRWVQFIDHMYSLPAGERDRILEALEGLSAADFEAPERTTAWHALMALVEQHRRFPDAQWTMPAAVTDRIQAVSHQFAPDSLVDLSVDLFDHHPYLAGVDMDDYPVYDDALRSARNTAASAVLETGGLEQLLELGRKVVLPGLVGFELAALGPTSDVEEQLLSHLAGTGSDGVVALGYAAAKAETEGLDWVKNELDGSDAWTPAQRAQLLLAPRTNLAVLDLVSMQAADTREEFWGRINPRFAESNAQAAIAHELIDRGRPWLAGDVLAGVVTDGAVQALGVDVDMVQSALLAGALGSSEDIGQIAMLAWEAGQLLDFLERSESDPVIRARIEFLLLPLLQHTRPARALSRALQDEPSLFVELVSYVSGPEGEPPEEVTEQRRAIAMAGYNALRAWHTPPGVGDDGVVDKARLQTWITEARRQLVDAKREALGDSLIGQVLSYLPADPDGLWPAHTLRELIEEVASPEFESGIENGRFNARGVHSRDIKAGGAPERALANAHRDWARRVADECPRTAAMLRRIAGNDEEWARHQDEQSSRFLDGD